MYFGINICDLNAGNFTLGFTGQESVGENEEEIYEFIIGFLFFEIIIGKVFQNYAVS